MNVSVKIGNGNVSKLCRCVAATPQDEIGEGSRTRFYDLTAFNSHYYNGRPIIARWSAFLGALRSPFPFLIF
jgi:hypothetical protein